MPVPTYSLVASQIIAPDSSFPLSTVRMGTPNAIRGWVVRASRLQNPFTADVAGFPTVSIRDTELVFRPFTTSRAYFDRGWLFQIPADFANSFVGLECKTAKWLQPVLWEVWTLSV